ncbi:hypothetical protein OHV05_34685 [Kitasatospora sp. NBC_00070]|uniref:hypothetical protein n=1 Tax=Kitasatospora sp. NBC_00070 TaxID=2975962 RepID=UPI003252DD0E
MTTTPTRLPTQARPAPDPQPALVLDPGAITDPVERERALARLLRFQAQVLTSHLRLGEGDRVRLLEPVHATWIDKDLAAEEHWEEDACTYADVPVGTLGVVTRVRRYPTLFPYVVAFDRDPGCAVRSLRIERTTDQPLTPVRPPAPDTGLQPSPH